VPSVTSLSPITAKSIAQDITKWAHRYGRNVEAYKVVYEYFRDVLKRPRSWTLMAEVRSEISRIGGKKAQKERLAHRKLEIEEEEREHQLELPL